MIKRTEINKDISNQIETEERRKRNKKILKILSLIFIPLFIIFSISYILLRYVGNIGIIVREYPIYSEKIDDNFNGIKIVQFSDIHYNHYTSNEKITKLINMINNTNPDIVIFTGDLIDANYEINLTEKEFLIKEFNKINSTLGKYALLGEEDKDEFKEIFSNSNFEILTNTVKTIHNKKSSIQLISVDDNYQTYSNLSINNNLFTIAITHKPDNADKIVEYFSPNIILAGHSHNGQVNLPIIGPLMKKIGSKKYIKSYYKINETELFISGGIGNTKYNMRLFTHPSINFFRLKSK